MFSTKTILAAASLAVLSAAGIGAAAAAPWDHRSGDHDRFDHRDGYRHERFERRAFVDRVRLEQGLRFLYAGLSCSGWCGCGGLCGSAGG